MTTSNIPLSLTINVSLAGTPSGLGEYNTNTICLFTNEPNLGISNYLWAVNAQDVINAYGTDSLTARMAQAIFTPVPNLRTGNGQLLVFHYDAENATSGSFITPDLSATIANFSSIANGKLTVNIDGEDYLISGLNFTRVTTIADVVTILKEKGLDCNIEAVGNTIKFTSRQYGTNSSITLKATEDGSGIDISTENYLNIESGSSEAGANESGTTLAEAVALAEQVGYFGGVITTQFLSNEGVKAYATSNQGLDHVYFEAIQSLNNIQSLGGAIESAGLVKTRLLAYTSEGDEASKIAIATYATIAQSTNYSGANTALTMNLKQLTGITPDTNMNTTYYNIAKQYGVDIYANTEGLSCVYSNDNGYFTDDATNLLWLKKALEVSGFNYLRKTNTKIPQTEVGMTGLKNAYETRCLQGVRNGVIGTGLTWNDSIPFGDPEDFQRNIQEKGYYIYSLPIAQQAQSEREERIAPIVQIAIKLSGAIHSSNVIVQIQR